ncbi:hypothetical protein LguiA_022990 [Lonicera macranthoides]
MKIQCNVCEVAEAKVLCWADEAALCLDCDDKVHAANKLATKHQRVSLSSNPNSSHMPNCDICQETVGYFFCLEDRALLCRKCDVAIHTANAYVSAHQRFLFTGVKVGLEPTDPGVSFSSGKSLSSEKMSEIELHSSSRTECPVPLAAKCNKVLPVQFGDFEPTKSTFAGGSTTGSTQHWYLDDFLGLTEPNQNYGYMDNSSSKADSDNKLGESACSPILRTAEIKLDVEECLGQVPNSSWLVPKITSPPTASGLYWPKNYQPRIDTDTAAFVPDIYSSPVQNLCHFNPRGTSMKQRW